MLRTSRGIERMILDLIPLEDPESDRSISHPAGAKPCQGAFACTSSGSKFHLYKMKLMHFSMSASCKSQIGKKNIKKNYLTSVARV